MDAKSLFVEAFYKERANYAGFKAEEIRAGGKRTKANPDKEDELWWLAQGPAMVQRWIDWRKSSNWKIWTDPEGKPGIELELAPRWADIPIVMFIDRVFVIPESGRLVVVDLKTGARNPESALQLAWYAAGLRSVYGIPVELGSYWDARKGEMSPVETLTRLSLPLITYWVSKFHKARQEGIYLPRITDMCRACGVNKFCAAYGGKYADRDPDFDRALAIPF